MLMADSLFLSFQYSQSMCDRDNHWDGEGKHNGMKRWRPATGGTRCKFFICPSWAVIVMLPFLAASLSAQQALLASGELPDAPVPQVSTSVSADQPTANVSGAVTDVSGAVIAGAAVTLENAVSHDKKTAVTNEQGIFTFAPLDAGIFTITIQSKGFAPVVKTGISLHAGENYQLSPTTMQVAAATATVEVGAQTQYELAEAQIKAEEKQRFLFIEPNFYVTYISNPAPLTAGQKMRLATRFAVDPFTFIYAGAVAGVEQANNDYPGYGRGAAGYGKRYGATVGDIVTGSIIGAGALPALLHQDPRYFYKGTGSIPSRIGYALATIVRTKGDDGKWQPNYSGILGDLASGAISNSYLAPGDRKGAVTVINGAVEGFALRGVTALEQEFLARWITTHSKDKGTIGRH
ncbi:carboxypeptidase-like regulatory domain-containing protein [Granulicella sp. WH15]|uniref:carboxypeptidase-like regulatory domain-containing protein n=1 Tax=Granulicella sp. WH15 TaxID=2602070 RepID=UPI0013A5900F|nr:carboxypeptidase-like regulatory domain-containing protein [Granulicella sp. WH15]